MAEIKLPRKVIAMDRFWLFLCICMVLGAFPRVSAQINILKEKKGWNFGFLPVLGYNTDLGFKYGGLVAAYDYGDGADYPKYRKMIRLEISRSTKGSGINQLFLDFNPLFRRDNIRLTADISYLSDQTSDFYGFNGTPSNYNAGFTDDNSDAYISRVFYKMERNLMRVAFDFQGNIVTPRFRWLAGFGFYNYDVRSVDIEKLNKGKSEEKKLPDTALLYDKYVGWGIIPGQEASGGHQQCLKFGLVYDSRDIQANPAKGIWSEVLVVTAPYALWNQDGSFTKLVVIHRQYFTLVRDRLTWVYRIGYQGTIGGNDPFYNQNNMYSSYLSAVNVQGLGGAKSLRGILRNRITGEGIAYANTEFRWKFLKFLWAKQNFYFALNPFLDMGMAVQQTPVDETKVPSGEDPANYFTGKAEQLHYSAGCGLHIAMNENFVIAADFGWALSRQDGKFGAYVGINWLF
jgi:hypothetical protein